MCRAPGRPAVRLAAGALKAIGFAALLLCLVEPLLTGSKPRRGANAFVILADNSQSMLIRDGQDAPTRGDWLRERLGKESPLEDPAGAGLRRPTLCVRLAPPRRRRLRRAGLRRRRLVADDRAPVALEAVPRTADRRRARLHRREPDRYRRPRLVAAPADLSRRAPVAGRRPGHRRPAASRSARPISSPRRSSSAPTSPRPATAGQSIVAVITDEAGKDVERQEAVVTRRRRAALLPIPVPAREEGTRLLPRPRLRPGRGAAAR